MSSIKTYFFIILFYYYTIKALLSLWLHKVGAYIYCSACYTESDGALRLAGGGASPFKLGSELLYNTIFVGDDLPLSVQPG